VKQETRKRIHGNVTRAEARKKLKSLKGEPRLLAGLNPEQRQAVTHGDGPLLILAGAGTGKTKVITHRIAWLIDQKKAKPDEILALTFTEKAASEMADRVYDLVPLGDAPANISTFHSFGDALLREFSYELKLPPNFTIMGEAEQVMFLEQHLFELPLDFLRPPGRPAKFLQKIAKAISRAKNENISPENYAAWVAKEERRVAGLPDPEVKADAQYDLKVQQEIAGAFKLYEQRKLERYRLDYADQVYLAVRLLSRNPVVRRRLRERFKYILVDEYQDTNVVQNQLLNLLAGPEGNLTVVGDDDQSIFAFQGSSISNILGFEETHPRAKRVVLTENYRSTQQILDAAHRLIQQNQDRLELKDQIDKKLTATVPPGPEVALERRQTVEDEADFVAEYIKQKQAKGTKYSEMAILIRVKSLIDPFRQALAVRDIPALAEGTGRLFDEPVIKLCVSFLRAVVDPLDSAALKYLSESSAYRMPQDDIFALAKQMRTTNRPLWELLPEAKGLTEAGSKAADKIREDLSKAAEQARDLDVGRVLYTWLAATGLLNRLRDEADERDARAARNAAKLFSRLQQFVRSSDDSSAAEWVRHLDDIIAIEDESVAAETDTDYDAVRILTAHSAKGLEFEVVFVSGTAQVKFPLKFNPETISPDPLLKDRPTGSSHLSEERRLFYVAMTRAKRELILTAASDYHTKFPWKISQFASEALGQSLTSILPADSPQPVDRINQSRPAPKVRTPYAAPERIRLSHTSIAAYQTCPLKYYWEFVVGLQEEPSHAMLYGTLMHQVIQEINLARAHGKDVTLEDALGWYEDSWRGEHFMSKEHERSVYEQGKQTLTRFVKEELTREPPTAVEDRFAVPLKGCVVEGKYDRIDRHAGKATIVDYKTGRVNSQAEADRRVKEDKQLTLYSLAYHEQHDALPDQVVFNYIDSALSAVGRRTESAIVRMRSDIERVAADIRAGKFEPNRHPHECSTFADCPGHKPTHRTAEGWY
jgi:ATP-dependent DNA helicase UvrD/PcrA